MNVALLIPELGGGGAQRVAQILGDYLVQKGENVYYFIGNNNIKQTYPVKGKIVKTNIRNCIYENGKKADMQNLVLLFKSSFYMRKLKHKYKIDVAISFMEQFNYINILSKGKEKVFARVCTILSLREDFVGILFRKDLVRLLYSKADKVIVMSDYGMRDMCKYYRVPRKRLVKIPNAVADRDMKEVVSPWEFGDMAVISVGRLESVKQHDRIIRAFSYVVQKERRAKLLILGDGSKRGYLKNLSIKYGIEDSVRFIGFTDKVSYYLKNSKVFVMASKVEGFPNSMIEAMNYGLPIIATDSHGGCNEIIGHKEKEKDGFLLCEYGIFTPGMPKEKVKVNSPLVKQELILGDAILSVLTDSEMHDEYKYRSFKRADMFHVDKVMKKWENLIL